MILLLGLVAKTCREVGESTPTPEHAVHPPAGALLMSSNLIFKPDLIHAQLSVPDELLGL